MLLRLLPVRKRCGSLHARRRGTTVAFLNLPLFAAGIRGNRRAAPAIAGVRALGPLGVRRRGTTVAFLNSPLFAAASRGNRRAAPAIASLQALRASGGAPSRYDGRIHCASLIAARCDSKI